MNRLANILVLVAALGTAAPVARADSPAALPAPAVERRVALGFTIDLLPTVMSATAGRFGMAGQVWVGLDHLKLRLVGAHMRMPNFLAAKDGFRDQDTTALAFLVDWVSGDHFDEWWVGTGFELWLNEIGHRDATERTGWTNVVYTLGGGYIWRVWRTLYIEPWAAVHVPMNDPPIRLAGATYAPLPVSAEVSLKVGWFFDL